VAGEGGEEARKPVAVLGRQSGCIGSSPGHGCPSIGCRLGGRCRCLGWWWWEEGREEERWGRGLAAAAHCCRAWACLTLAVAAAKRLELGLVPSLLPSCPPVEGWVAGGAHTRGRVPSRQGRHSWCLPRLEKCPWTREVAKGTDALYS